MSQNRQQLLSPPASTVSLPEKLFIHTQTQNSSSDSACSNSSSCSAQNIDTKRNQSGTTIAKSKAKRLRPDSPTTTSKIITSSKYGIDSRLDGGIMGCRSGFGCANCHERAPAVILLTDIGLDIDDTFALFLLIGAHNLNLLNLVGIFTTLNQTEQRAKLVQHYLSSMFVRDVSTIEVVPGLDAQITGDKSGPFPVYFPPDLRPNGNLNKLSSNVRSSGNNNINGHNRQRTLPKKETSPRKLLDLCGKYQDDGVIIIGIGALSTLFEAIKLDEQLPKSILKSSLKRVYFQGHVNFAPEERGFEPATEAFNYLGDYKAAKGVFDYFFQHVPITTLGKYAAYQVKLKKLDLVSWSQQMFNEGEYYYDVTKRGLVHLRQHKPLSFSGAHPKAPEDGCLDSWFDDQSDTYGMAAAFDPLLSLVLVMDLRREFSLDNSVDTLFQKVVLKVGKITHNILGNSAEVNSILDAEAVHDVLVKYISEGLEGKARQCL